MITMSKPFETKDLAVEKELHLKFELQAFLKPDQLFWEGKRFDSLSKDPAIDGLTPMVHVFPESQQQIESILELANNYDTKVWLNSSDKNRGYLNTIESKKSIVLHLIQMKPFQSTPLDDTPNLCLDLYVGF